MQFPDSKFWDFSISFYRQPEVEKTCLVLQNDFELDVNCVLFIYWLSSKHHAVLSTKQWSEMISISLPWQEIIKSLRKSRQLIKDSTIAWPAEFQQETRACISEVEINAEHMQQLAMEKLLQDLEPKVSDDSLKQLITSNFSNMFSVLNNEMTTEKIYKQITSLITRLTNVQENKKIIA